MKTSPTIISRLPVAAIITALVFNLIISLPLLALPATESSATIIDDFDRIDSVVESLDQRIQRLLLQNQELRQQITELETGLEQTKTEKSEKLERIEHLVPLIKENHQLRQQLEATRSRVERLNREVQRLSSESGLTDQQERLRRELDVTIAARQEIEEAAVAFRKERRKLEESLRQTSIEREIAKRQRQEYRQDIAELEKQNQQLKKQLADRKPAAPKTVDEQVAERNRQIQELRRSISQLHREKDNLAQELRKKTEGQQTQAEEQKRLQSELRQMKHNLEKLREKRTTLTRTNQQYLHLLQLQEREIGRLEKMTPDLIDKLGTIILKAQKETPSPVASTDAVIKSTTSEPEEELSPAADVNELKDQTEQPLKTAESKEQQSDKTKIETEITEAADKVDPAPAVETADPVETQEDTENEKEEKTRLDENGATELTEQDKTEDDTTEDDTTEDDTRRKEELDRLFDFQSE